MPRVGRDGRIILRKLGFVYICIELPELAASISSLVQEE